MQDKIGLIRSSLRHELICTFKRILRLYTDVLVEERFLYLERAKYNYLWWNNIKT